MAQYPRRRAVGRKIELPGEYGWEYVELLMMMMMARRNGALLVRVGGQRVVLDGCGGVGAPQTIPALEIHTQAVKHKSFAEKSFYE